MSDIDQSQNIPANHEVTMQTFEVTMSRPGSGSGTFKIVVPAATPDMARRTAEHQNPGYAAHAVKAAR